jgi:hypothetical protein
MSFADFSSRTPQTIYKLKDPSLGVVEGQISLSQGETFSLEIVNLKSESCKRLGVGSDKIHHLEESS